MKVIIISIFLSLTISSCSYMDDNQIKEPHNPEIIQIDNTGYSIYTLEGCEYIVVGMGSGKWGSHKGNCKNPIHKTK